MKNSKATNLNKSVDDLLASLDLPSDSEVIEETRRIKISSKRTGIKLSDKTKNLLSKVITEKQSDPTYKKYMSDLRNSMIDMPIDETGQTLREKITKANRLSAKNPKHHANRVKANQRQKNDPKWKEAHAKGVLKYSEEVMTPMGFYPSMRQWMKKFNKPGGRSFLKSLPHLFYKVQNGPGKQTYERIYYTPFGKCSTDHTAYELSIKNNEPNAIKLKNIGGWWLKMATLYPEQYYVKYEVAKYWPVEKEKLFGLNEMDSKPRLTKEKMLIMKEKWKKRLKLHKTFYKTR